MDEQARSQEAVQPGVFLHPDESPPAGHLIASLFYKWRKWSELNTQCSCAAGAINPAVELSAPVQDRCAFWICWGPRKALTHRSDDGGSTEAEVWLLSLLGEYITGYLTDG